MKLRHFLGGLTLALWTAIAGAASLVVLPQQLVVDVNGAPRSGAKLFVYEAGTTAPLTTYTTSALDPAAVHTNPVLTISTGLFPPIWINPSDGPYKLVLQDAAGGAIYTTDNIPTASTPQDFVTPEQFGAVGDGVADDKAEVQAAFDTCENVLFTADTYFLGTANSGAFLTAGCDGQVFMFEGGSTLKANGNTGVTNTAAIVYIDGNSQITFINPRLESNWGVDADRDAPYGFGLGVVTGNTRNITFINPVAYKTQALVQATKETYNDAFEVENVEIINGYADNVYYGTGWSRTGNHVKANYKTLNSHRAYFPYGVHSHDVTVFDEHDGTVASPTSYLHQVIIGATSFTGSIAAKDTYNIKLNYTVKGTQYTGIPFLFHIDHLAADTKKGVLRDIDVTYNDRGTGVSKSIGFVYFLDSVVTASYTGTAWDRIKIRGYAKNPFDLTSAGVLGGAVEQTVLGTLDIGDLEMNATPTGSNNPHSGTGGLFDSGRIFDDAVADRFTPTIIGTGTAGAGTYNFRFARYHKRGRNVDLHAGLSWSAHTGAGNITVGTLQYPVLTLSNYMVPCTITADSLTFTGQLSATVQSGESVVRVSVAATGAALTALALDTAAAIYLSCSYESN